jgi:hypothetical protein
MVDGQGLRVFDRENWQRKARPPTWFQRAEIEKRSLPTANSPTTEKW